VSKAPQHRAARDAYDVASGLLAANYQRRVTATAAGDTVRGANLAMEYGRFRGEVARHGASLAAAPEYDRAERAILRGAARIHYDRGAEAMAAGRSRVAGDEFSTALHYDAEYVARTCRSTDAERVSPATGASTYEALHRRARQSTTLS
jgi:hypothetical protein